MSSSVSNISFRYHPEDEELEDIYDTSSSIKSEGTSEESSTNAASADVPTRVLGRLGIREETDKWKLFREVKGRITKSVEDKIEEIKTERLKNQSKQRRSVLGQMEQSSVSDSEEQSESSQPASDKSTRSAPDSLVHPVKSDKTEGKPESDASCSQGSTPERSLTPVPTPTEEMLDDESSGAVKRGKGIKSMLKRKKGKTKNEKGGNFDKTTISYSALCDNDSDSEAVEVAQEVLEVPYEPSETELAKELDRLAHPTLFWRVERFIYEWHIIIMPLAACMLNWFIQLPQYVTGFLVGVIGLLLLQKIAAIVKGVWGCMESPMKDFKDMLPLTEVPIFRRSVYETDVSETVFEGWLNEYSQDYSPETYHVSLTEAVYVTLDGSKLKLSSPKSKVPKRALWNEPRYKLIFNRERLYDIANCRVEMKPEMLIHRRIWSKKYPICITLTPASKLGTRHRENHQETVDEDAPWIEEKYNFDTISEDSDDERTVPSLNQKERIEDYDTLSPVTELSIDSSDFPSVSDMVLEEKDSLEESFVQVCEVRQDSLLYLFARTDREKEIWFRRLTAATKGNSSPESSPTQKAPQLEYLSFMLTLSQRTVAHLPPSKEQTSKNNVNLTDLSISTDMMWLNAFLGRMLFDLFRDPDKLVKIQEKIQKKLSGIKLPVFLEKLEVSHLDLGQTVPIIQRATRPTLNAQGIWVDLDLVYEGGFKMIVDTKVNLNRLKQLQPDSPNSESPKSGSPAKNSSPTLQQSELQCKRAVYDSSVEDSAETSSEEPEMLRPQDPNLGPVNQHKYLRILDKVAQSKYFQQVIDYKFIKNFVTGSNLQLVVEVKGLLGTLVLNIPPPPADRLWYGFRTNPKLWLSAQPKFGQHAVHVISRIIEKKLSLEFQRLLVLPNMDDLYVPLMDHNVPR